MSMSFAPWSISKAQVAHNCTLQFNLKYAKKERGKTVVRSEGRVGAAAHEFMENILAGHPVDFAYKKAVIDNKLARNETLTLATYKDAVLQFRDRIAAWRMKMGVRDTDFFIEKEVAFTREMEVVDYWDKTAYYRGKWDIGALVQRNDGLYVIIMDHKTGQPGEDLSRYKDQLWAYIASAMVMYPHLSGAQTAVHWMKAETPKEAIVWGDMYKADQIKAEILPWFFSYFDAANARGNDVPLPSQGWQCDFCEYKYKCPLFM